MIKKNDVVKVISGDERGKTGKVLNVAPDGERVLVEGLNFVWKHMKRSQQHPHGARIQKEAPLRMSNLQIVCQACNKSSRVILKRLEDGGRTRLCRKCRQAVAPEV